MKKITKLLIVLMLIIILFFVGFLYGTNEYITFIVIFFIIVATLILISDEKKGKYKQKTLKKTEFDNAYRFQCHADDHYAQRINFFLVAESMLVISFVTSLTNQTLIPEGIGQSISIIGLIFTSIWLYTNARLEERSIYMIENYLKNYPIYNNYINSAGGMFSKALLTYSLPISLNLLWVYFLCHSYGKNPWIWIIESFLFMVAISTWMNWIHIPKNITSNKNL